MIRKILTKAIVLALLVITPTSLAHSQSICSELDRQRFNYERDKKQFFSKFPVSSLAVAGCYAAAESQNQSTPDEKLLAFGGCMVLYCVFAAEACERAMSYGFDLFARDEAIKSLERSRNC